MSTAAAEQERPHHPYSPSTLANLEQCPCYRSRQDIDPHERTIAGTKAHKVVETGEDDNSLSDEDAAAAAECLDLVEQRKQLMAEEASRASFGGVPVTELKEIYLPVDGLTFFDAESTTAGYVDRVLLNWDHTHADMLDWKFGRWAVERAEDNLQGIAYVLGLFKMYPTLKTITVFFKQPLLEHLTTYTFKREDFDRLYFRVVAVVAQARVARLKLLADKTDFSMAKPAVPLCCFCGLLGVCSHGLKAGLHVGKKFLPVEFPEDITPSSILSAENTTLAMRLAQVVKVWADAFKRQVTDRVLRGDASMPEGYTLQENEGRREISDPDKFKAEALKYITEADYNKCLSASFGAVETAISDAAPRGAKKARVSEFRDLLENMSIVTRGLPYSYLRVKPTKAEE